MAKKGIVNVSAKVLKNEYDQICDDAIKEENVRRNGDADISKHIRARLGLSTDVLVRRLEEHGLTLEDINIDNPSAEVLKITGVKHYIRKMKSKKS